MLYLIGIGLWNEKDISLRGVDACKKCEYVYAELYTAKWGGNIEILGKIVGKNITIINRRDLEEKSKDIIEKARERDIAVLMPGDPLFATTHIKLLQEAKEKNIKTEVIHSSSIYTAVAESGLNVYNFGKTVSIPSPEENFQPISYYEEIAKNKAAGLHTLILLDIEMTVQDAMKILFEIEDEKKKKVIKEDNKIVVVSRLGSKNRIIKYDTASAISKESIPAPAAIIIPSKLHFIEEEFLEKL
ncbi:MAG: diphthine synthase [Nanoarchaeota archaeon]